ncbi:hypothetical protein ACFQ1S_11330 [Kibdelosporangium lantanae]|uniref:Uncharacterized protein n=1 Tax=Kibdelosporangium lantanae TaxID=1497396 RepID=A0ABW3M650_9PSEU
MSGWSESREPDQLTLFPDLRPASPPVLSAAAEEVYTELGRLGRDESSRSLSAERVLTALLGPAA